MTAAMLEKVAVEPAELLEKAAVAAMVAVPVEPAAVAETELSAEPA